MQSRQNRDLTCVGLTLSLLNWNLPTYSEAGTQRGLYLPFLTGSSPPPSSSPPPLHFQEGRGTRNGGFKDKTMSLCPSLSPVSWCFWADSVLPCSCWNEGLGCCLGAETPQNSHQRSCLTSIFKVFTPGNGRGEKSTRTACQTVTPLQDEGGAGACLSTGNGVTGRSCHSFR